MKTVAIYLAAGASKRMGKDKRLLLFNGVPIGSITFRNALLSKIDHIFVATRKGDSLNFLPPFFFLYPMSNKWSQVECKQASLGQSYSIRCGLKRAIEYGADAIIVLLADQPFVTTEIINTLIDSYQKEPHYSFIAAENHPIPMPPILFSNQCFPLLEQLQGDQGARYVIRECILNTGKMIDFQDPLLFFDIDSVEDYISLLKLRGE